MYILAGIPSLLQYIAHCRDDKIDRLAHCPGCGLAKPWYHGCYSRKSARTDPSSRSLNPILIQRYYCLGCGKTCSVLPECIPPRRWYLWETQQTAILLFLLGQSARAVEHQVPPSRHTIKRWVVWLITQFKSHKDALCSHIPSLGLLTECADFWKHIFNQSSLSAAMRLCHVMGVSIP